MRLTNAPSVKVGDSLANRNCIWVPRSVDDSDIRSFMSGTDTVPRLLLVTGEQGVGRTTLVQTWLRSWAQNGDVFLHLAQWAPLDDYSDLSYSVFRSLRSHHRGNLPLLSKATKKFSKAKELDFLGFLQRRVQTGHLDGAELTHALVTDLSDIKQLWITLDHASVRSTFTWNWIREHLFEQDVPFRLRIIVVWDHLATIDIDQVDLPRKEVRLNVLSDKEIRSFCNQENSKETILGRLTWQEARRLSGGSPVWLQWLATCPPSWFADTKDTDTLYANCLGFLRNAAQADLLALLSMSSWISPHLIRDINVDDPTVSQEALWILDTPLVEMWDDESVTLHESIRGEIAQEVDKGMSVHSTQQYSEKLHHFWVERLQTDSEDANSTHWKSPFWRKCLQEALRHGFAMSGVSESAVQLLKREVAEAVIHRPFGLVELSRVLSTEYGTSLYQLWHDLLNRDWAAMNRHWHAFHRDRHFSNIDRQAPILVLGLLHYLLDNYKEAEKAFDASIHCDPACAIAYFGKGLIQVDTRKWAQAILEFDRAIERDSEFALAHNERGAAYFALGDYVRASNDYEMAISIDPEYVHALVNLGIVYQQTGQAIQAAYWLQRALDVDAEEARWYITLVGRVAQAEVGTLQ